MIVTEEKAKKKCGRLGRPKSTEHYEDRYSINAKLESLSIPEPNTGCIIWIGALNDSGYGRVKVKNKFKRAHRLAWELKNGSIPHGLVIDHTVCQTRCCINLLHMEVVTQGENCRRGNHRRYNRDTY